MLCLPVHSSTFLLRKTLLLAAFVPVSNLVPLIIICLFTLGHKYRILFCVHFVADLLQNCLPFAVKALKHQETILETIVVKIHEKLNSNNNVETILKLSILEWFICTQHEIVWVSALIPKLKSNVLIENSSNLCKAFMCWHQFYKGSKKLDLIFSNKSFVTKF